MQKQRVVITGLGVLAPNGCGKEAFWQACLQGLSGVRAIKRFDASAFQTRIAGEVEDFAPEAAGLTTVEQTLLDRNTQFAIAAANLAMQDGGLDNTPLGEDDRMRTGVYLGTAMACVEKGESLWLRLSQMDEDVSGLPPSENELATFMLSNMPAAAVAAHHCLRGPNLTISTGCSSGADAIGQAFWLIQQGSATRMLAGGSDSALSPLGIGVFDVIHAMSTRNEDPTHASRPYDAHRDGFVLSEGAAMLLLEERELALARGAHIYAEIVAFVSNSNAYHMTALPTNGAPLQALLRQVMDEAELTPAQLGYINSHGSSTHANDSAETAAYKGALGAHAYHIPISSTKSTIGHTQGAASAIEALVTALALDRQTLPPTSNLETLDPLCDLDYIPNYPRLLDKDHPLHFALTHSSGFGGVNTALMLSRHTTSLEESAAPVAPLSAPGSSRRTSTSIVERRVVVTGLGTMAPGGVGKAAFWETRLSGRMAIEPFSAPDGMEENDRFAGQIKAFRAEDYIEHKLANRTDRVTHMALAAVQEALLDSGLELEREDPQRIGAVIANTLGGVEYAARQVEHLYRRGPRFISAYTAIAWLHVANVGQVSVRHGLQGYSKTPVNDLAGGLDALGLAYNAIKRGAADVLIAGGSEAPLHPYSLKFLAASLPLSQHSGPGAYRPFDQRASGLLPAEGAGICILEDYEHALKRGAPIYGELVGYAQTCAPRESIVRGFPDVATYTRTLQLALAEAGLTPAEIACVYLDGRALPAWDACETRALHEVFGSAFDTLACSIPRTQIGHNLAAAGALDTIGALLGLQEGVVPPTSTCDEPDPHTCPPGLVRNEARLQTSRADAALVCARSFGGSHVVLALRNIK